MRNIVLYVLVPENTFHCSFGTDLLMFHNFIHTESNGTSQIIIRTGMYCDADQLSNNGVSTEELFSTLRTVRYVFINTGLTDNVAGSTAHDRNLSGHTPTDRTFQDFGHFNLEITHCLGSEFWK